ncbi:MAG: hypothetical protein WCJ92_04240 [Alphaproteobacteria bacterium]
MNFSQKFLIVIVALFMKVCASGALNLDAVDLGEVTPPTTYTVPTNTPISRANGEDAEILSIFIGAEDRNSASFKALLEELSSSRVNNDGILSAEAAESASQKIANRVPTPYYKREETTVISLGAAAKPQTDVVSGWSWWYRWLSSFIS